MDFDGKVVVVTGGASGIGRATAIAFADKGARVVVVDLNQVGAMETLALIEQDGGTGTLCIADVSKSEDVTGYVNQAVEQYGTIDCFFNNAGVEGRVAPIHEASEEVFDSVIAINLRGVFLGLRHVLPVMIRAGAGAVVNTSSVGGLVATPGMAPYIASKHGVVGLTKAAAGDVARYGVRVNAICPGAVDTPMMRGIAAQRAHPASDGTLAQYGAPSAIADVALYLCSDASRVITGASIVCDEGRTVYAGGHLGGALLIGRDD